MRCLVEVGSNDDYPTQEAGLVAQQSLLEARADVAGGGHSWCAGSTGRCARMEKEVQRGGRLRGLVTQKADKEWQIRP